MDVGEEGGGGGPSDVLESGLLYCGLRSICHVMCRTTSRTVILVHHTEKIAVRQRHVCRRNALVWLRKTQTHTHTRVVPGRNTYKQRSHFDAVWFDADTDLPTIKTVCTAKSYNTHKQKNKTTCHLGERHGLEEPLQLKCSQPAHARFFLPITPTVHALIFMEPIRGRHDA